MNNIPWMKLYYSLLDWEWIKCPEMVCIWVNILLRASSSNHKEKGMNIKRGQLVTSVRELAEQCGLSVRTTRTCIERLKSTHQITQSSTHKATIITICKYDKYQDRPHTDRHTDRHTERQTADTVPTQCRHSGQNTPFSSFLHEKSKHIESVRINARTREAQAPQQEPSEEFKHFQAWIDANAPSVAKLRDPFTEDQFNKLREAYSAERVRDILLQMHNRPDLAKKYRSAYLTALNWLKRNNNYGQSSNNRRQDVPPRDADNYGESTI